MMQSDKEVKEVEILRIEQVTSNLIELKRQHEAHLFATGKRWRDAFLQSWWKRNIFNKASIKVFLDAYKYPSNFKDLQINQKMQD